MGSKRKALRRSVNATQKLRYPVGELALRKKQLKELNSLRKKLNRAKDKVCFGIVYYVCWDVYMYWDMNPHYLVGSVDYLVYCQFDMLYFADSRDKPDELANK